MRTADRGVLVGVAAAALVTVGGVAYATIPDSGGTIHGCYSKASGLLSVIDSAASTCKPNQQSLEWNVQGQQGPPGADGATGPMGPAGVSGLSHAFSRQQLSVNVVDVSTSNGVYGEVASISSIPDGKYLIWAQNSFSDGGDTFTDCRLGVNGVAGNVVLTKLTDGAASATIVDAEELASGSNSVGVYCIAGDNLTIDDATLTLVTVDALN